MSYKAHIDWAWGNYGAPSGRDAEDCKEAVIQGVRRGDRSAHDCVIECINEWLQNRDFRTAVLWLTKGAECHNRSAQDEINAQAGAAVRYAVTTYGPSLRFIEEFTIKENDFRETASTTKV